MSVLSLFMYATLCVGAHEKLSSHTAHTVDLLLEMVDLMEVNTKAEVHVCMWYVTSEYRRERIDGEMLDTNQNTQLIRWTVLWRTVETNKGEGEIKSFWQWL